MAYQRDQNQDQAEYRRRQQDERQRLPAQPGADRAQQLGIAAAPPVAMPHGGVCACDRPQYTVSRGQADQPVGDGDRLDDYDDHEDEQGESERTRGGQPGKAADQDAETTTEIAAEKE